MAILLASALVKAMAPLPSDRADAAVVQRSEVLNFLSIRLRSSARSKKTGLGRDRREVSRLWFDLALKKMVKLPG